jgi:hypothetical protein
MLVYMIFIQRGICQSVAILYSDVPLQQGWTADILKKIVEKRVSHKRQSA